MADMARISCDAYRAVVRQDERFVSFFQSITPGGWWCQSWPVECVHNAHVHGESQVRCAGHAACAKKSLGGSPTLPFCWLVAVNELGRMNIGSRPAKRRTHGSIDTLRAIPWIFAWTQVGPVWAG